VGKPEVHLRAGGVTPVGDERGQVVKDDREVKVCFADGHLDHFQPDGFQVRVERIQGPA